MSKENFCVHKVPIFNKLTINEMQEVTNLLKHYHFKKGETIYTPGITDDKLYIVNEGRVKISRLSDDGKEQVIRILETGDFTGDLSLFNNEVTLEFATALLDTNMCTIDRTSLYEHMAKHPLTAIKIVESLSKRLKSAETLIEGMTIRDSKWRLAQVILQEANSDNIFTFKTTKAIFASKLGMTQETLSRKLGELQDDKLIKVLSSKELLIIDKLKLSTYIE